MIELIDNGSYTRPSVQKAQILTFIWKLTQAYSSCTYGSYGYKIWPETRYMILACGWPCMDRRFFLPLSRVISFLWFASRPHSWLSPSSLSSLILLLLLLSSSSSSLIVLLFVFDEDDCCWKVHWRLSSRSWLMNARWWVFTYEQHARGEREEAFKIMSMSAVLLPKRIEWAIKPSISW